MRDETANAANMREFGLIPFASIRLIRGFLFEARP